MGEPGVAVVIEDDEDVRNLVDAILKEAGFVVHSAATGREGVEVVRDKRAAVVTLDVGLPDMDGHEVLRRIRQFSDAYVVMLTARRDEPDTLTAFLTGADDYVKKPFLPRELRARVTAMMRRPRATDSFASHPEGPGVGSVGVGSVGVGSVGVGSVGVGSVGVGSVGVGLAEAITAARTNPSKP